MALLTALFVYFAIASTVLSGPLVEIRDSLVRLPIVKRIHQTGTSNILAHDQARARRLLSRRQDKRQSSISATNGAVTYTASVGVGSPPTYYDLIIDTGSSNTWIGASAPYVPTSSSQDTDDAVSVSYGSGSFSGTECEFICRRCLSPH